MAEEKWVERRMYERRQAARRGSGLEPTLEEIFAEDAGGDALEPPTCQDRRGEIRERRVAIRRQVDRELHAFIVEETGD